MRAAVVVFPGSNADAEMVRTLREICGVETSVIWHTATSLPERIDLVALPGGFSYGDYLRCGAIAKVSPVLPAIVRHAKRGGSVLGVCNGFQILTEVGLLPGALTRNRGLRFECRDVHVKVHGEGPFTPRLGEVWRMPIAHAEGRYQASDEVLRVLAGEGRIGLVYSTPDGRVTDDANPNGSQHSIAGIYGRGDAGRGAKNNIFGLMPHPERMSEAVLGSADGRKLFDAVLAAV
jgi:phosphoribosylformylglycinamidine synthase subunit PurQ / glutaminase